MSITVVLLINDRIYYASADRGGEITFGSGKKDTVKINGMSSSQVMVKINFDSFNVSAKKAVRGRKQERSLWKLCGT